MDTKAFEFRRFGKTFCCGSSVICGAESLRIWRSAFFCFLFLVLASTTEAVNVSTLDDIQFWAGEGANRAALVLDWDDTSTSDEALVWGYRWDNAATGEDMLRAILAADERLFAKISLPLSQGIAVYGWGYDHNNDEQFSISDSTSFDADGIALSGPPDNLSPAATSNDPADHYAEGWLTGFWNYSLSSGDPFDGGSWNTSGGGTSSRVLTDGDWDGWTFSSSFNTAAFPVNPQAAVAPLTADFNNDNQVDGADFLVWQRGFGIMHGALPSQGDADDNGAVNALDLQAWAMQYGSGTPIGFLGATTLTVPEPTTIVSVLCAIVSIFSTRFFNASFNCTPRSNDS
ncbi:MAG: hypothetical protein MI725_05050 [Pirellulales bacterium]|nr:hypothetical protein [Pirellulales bacterium]